MKLMRCTILPVMAAGLIVGMCLCAACVFGPSGQTQTAVNKTSVTTAGLVQIPGDKVHESYSLEDAAAGAMSVYQVNGSQQNLPIYYIRGENVDTSGKADRWVFGVREGKNATMIVYDQTGVAKIAWQDDGLPDQEITIAGIRSPSDIMNIAHSGNQTTTGNPELEISRGEYTVTEPPGSSPRAYVINATTGVVISSND
jgi:hypothetical protein